MHNLLSILLAISLSWVTTGYACSTDRLAEVSAICCCPHDHEQASASQDDSSSADANMDRCCDIVLSSAMDQQQPGIASAAYPSLDLPAVALPVAQVWTVSSPATFTLSAPPPARGPPSAGTRTYLATARLRL